MSTVVHEPVAGYFYVIDPVVQVQSSPVRVENVVLDHDSVLGGHTVRPNGRTPAGVAVDVGVGSGKQVVFDDGATRRGPDMDCTDHVTFLRFQLIIGRPGISLEHAVLDLVVSGSL